MRLEIGGKLAANGRQPPPRRWPQPGPRQSGRALLGSNRRVHSAVAASALAAASAVATSAGGARNAMHCAACRGVRAVVRRARARESLFSFKPVKSAGDI